MPHFATLTGETAKEIAETNKPFGAGFSKETVDAMDKLVIEKSSFTDTDEYVIFRAYRGTEILGCQRVNGY
jgi:hypothetical protein